MHNSEEQDAGVPESAGEGSRQAEEGSSDLKRTQAAAAMHR